jgi:hypothetical protein
MDLILLPHDVGSTREAHDIYALFDELVGRLTR